MTVEEMRASISQVYPGQGWRGKCERMSPGQVIAVYYNFIGRGSYERRLGDTPKAQTPPPTPPRQLCIFDMPQVVKNYGDI